ncbi:MAG TPA: AMP-binding protein [Methanomassiliicoccales archaeon]|nr:AMP-binding protein [Methanomassiliicoccales archaeon]HNX47186.1 AMP-binding protein [Methanomassiliicoccales archaeon]HPR97994.1 AMP-binding protein [Methanomassiliicoccales archaeon]
MPRENITREATIGQLLDEIVDVVPDQDAVVYADRDYRQTWREFRETVDKAAKGLMALGVKKGDKVAMWATNVPHWVTLQFATARIGAILLTININYRSAEIDYLLRQSDCENIFVIDGYRDTDYVNTLYELIPELKTQPRDRLRSERYPHLRRVLFLGPEKHRGMYSWNELLAMSVAVSDDDYRQRQSELSTYDVVNMQYTSGTTGFPKGVMLTHFNLTNNGYWVGVNENFTTADRVCIPVPLFHCFGCVLAVMACLNHGATMVILERYDPINVMMSIEKERCTALYGVPTMFIGILDHKLFDKFDFSTLRTGIMAGSPCPVKTMEECVERMNMREVTIVFGLTESSPAMTQTRYDEPSLEKKCSTVGKAFPGIEVAIIDPETGEHLGPGKHGELCCRGHNVMKGYYKMPEETAKAIDKDGWLHSGDIGMMDEDGYYAVTGRLKDMIIRGGENIYPKEVEDFIHHMDGVADVQVVGVPSVKYGELPAAFVVLRPGVKLTAEDIMDHCRGKIAFYKIPKFVHFVEEYPMTASGKIMKMKLREMSATLWPDA